MELPVPPKFVESLKNISAAEGTQVIFDGFVEGMFNLWNIESI